MHVLFKALNQQFNGTVLQVHSFSGRGKKVKRRKKGSLAVDSEGGKRRKGATFWIL